MKFRERKREALKILKFLNDNRVSIHITEPGRRFNGVQLRSGRKMINHIFRENFPEAKTSRRLGGMIKFHEFGFYSDDFYAWTMKNDWFDRMFDSLTRVLLPGMRWNSRM